MRVSILRRMRPRARTVLLAWLTWTAIRRHRVVNAVRATLQLVLGQRVTSVWLGRLTWMGVRAHHVCLASKARTRVVAT